MNIRSKMMRNTLKYMGKITGGKLKLGKLLWAIRKSDEISLVEFAAKLHLSKQHLCDIEHGRKTVSPKLAAQYAEKLGYPKEQFIRLALQDLMDRQGLNFVVEIYSKNSRKSNRHPRKLAA